MFKIGNVPEVEKLDLSSMQNDFIKSFVDGLVADRLIQKDLVILDPFEDDDQFLSFQIYYPQTPEKRVIIQIERPKSVIKVFVESETFIQDRVMSSLSIPHLHYLQQSTMIL